MTTRRIFRKTVFSALAAIWLLGCAGCGAAARPDPTRPGEPAQGAFAAGPAPSGETEPSAGDVPAAPSAENETPIEEAAAMRMNVQVGGAVFTAVLEENEAVSALVERMEAEPVTIEMSDYSGFEKVGPLGQSLPAQDSQATTQPGDIVLYCGNQIVIFYGSNSWSYTRLGRIENLDGWEEALGSGAVTVTFSMGG